MRLTKLRTRVSICLLLLVGTIAAIGYGISSHLLATTSERQTARNQQADLDRALQFVATMQSGLAVSNHDYAEWTDSIDFMHGNKPDYLDSNFNPGTMDNLNTHFILFIRKDHTLYQGITRADDGHSTIGDDHPIWSTALNILTPYWSLPLKQGTTNDCLTGWYNGLPILLAAHPIRDPSNSQPEVEGWLVMIRLLDGTALHYLQEITNLDVRFFKTTPPNISPAEVRPLPDSLGSNSILVQVPPDPQLLEQLTLGDRTMISNIILILIATGLGTTLLYERMVMRPLRHFSHLAQLHTDSMLTKQRWPLLGNEEFDSLASSLNSMVDQLQESERTLYNEARRDGLTQLGNRKLLTELLGKYSEMVGEYSQHRVALLILDLDDFKIINDSLGHESGDRILATLAEHLKEMMRDTDLLFRMGGDEFAIISLLVRQGDDATSLAGRLLHDLSCLPIEESGRSIQINASIGIAYNNGNLGADELIRNADLAMYDAKQGGKHCYRCYTTMLHQQFSHRMQLEQDLREAFQQGRLEVWYQPITDTSLGRPAMLEALCRWPTPNGFCPPNEFIPLAEQSGLIVPLGLWVADEAMRTLQELRLRHPHLEMNINLSVLQLMEADLVEQLCERVDRYQLPRSAVHLELTESLFADSHSTLVEQLLALAKAGFKIHLDDFGTGYSSLERLVSMPISAIKLDHSFTQTLQRGDDRLVRAVLLLGRELDMPVIAEGVETEAEYLYLSRLGCHLMQGYLFAKPMPREGVTSWLDKATKSEISLIDGLPQTV